MSTKDWHEVQEAASGVCLPFAQKGVACLSYSYPIFPFLSSHSLSSFLSIPILFLYLPLWLKAFFFTFYTWIISQMWTAPYFLYFLSFSFSQSLSIFAPPLYFFFSPFLSLSVSHSVNSLLCVSLIHLSMFAKRFKQILFVWRWTNLCADTFTDFRQWIPFYGDIHGTYIRW